LTQINEQTKRMQFLFYKKCYSFPKQFVPTTANPALGFLSKFFQAGMLQVWLQGCMVVSFSGIWRFHRSCSCQDDSDICYACAVCRGALRG